jgi:hypothetical protein
MENLRRRETALASAWNLVVVYSLRINSTVDRYRKIAGKKNFPPRKGYILTLVLYSFITEFARAKIIKT